ncbi:thiopeptide-type bacteriocin biosynthesis protein [Chitinophaga niastensis]|uniref:Thiopeptide-type bacteriocin biosynthesis protein n=1 Tax=Chitinophaga niastensis TaxID=536980 RepID=A0A2P8HP88_CHINA|nr:lantibiotic dehydratase [Chitinophaga niastensis]PSL48028.1 thiopeptide-type bacteriocin biosynthesis protein [Chitinophaga niastensis]
MALSHTGFFLLRSPLFPINRYREVLQGSLPELAHNNPLFIYALYIASKDLLKELERYISDPAAFNQKKTDKLRKSLYKYWVRACTRSTPYGLFAGCTTGIVDKATSLQLNSIHDAHQYVRLDMDYYTKICNHIQQLPAVSNVLYYYPNNSIYKSGDKYRYAEYTITNNRRKYLLTAVEDSVFIEKIIRETASGLTIPAMVQIILTEDNTIPEEEAIAFVRELIDAQLLIADIEPKITGTDNLEVLINRLSSIEDAAALRDGLIALQQLFQQQDYEQTRLAAIHQTCETAFPLSAPKDLLQIDLFKTASQCTMGETLMQGIVTQVNSLLALCHGYTKGQSDMSGFATRFRELYESQEMPLNLVLDGETGIGYGAGIESTVHAPFVEDVASAAPAENTTVNWSLLQQLALDKYEEFLREGKDTVMITDEDLNRLGDPETVQMASSVYLFGTLLAPAAGEADKGNYLFALHSMGGPSAANLLGRFCNGDIQLAEKVKTVLEAEAAANPDVVLAEVVHFPEARATNVLIRPALRPFEIPYIGVAGVAGAYQIPVSDLMVSVRNNEVVLRSRRLNKRVIPRLSSAHNYSFNSLPIYKFLCDLQHQSVVSSLHWDWGVFASRQRLPRVMYKNIIVSRACWTMIAKDIEQLGEDEAAQLLFFEQYRAKQEMPEKVLLSEADNELVIDLTQPASIQVLLDQIRKSSTVKLKEFLFEEKGGVVRDHEDNIYAHELLIPLTCTLTSDKPRPVAGKDMDISMARLTPRNFAPGSEWLYVKIYCGFMIAEELLSGYFAEQVPEWQEDGLFEQFFFLRYGDPQPHIRLRFLNSAHPSNNDVLLHLIETALQKYIRTGQVQKIQCDTYVREIERYGADTIMYSEQLFCADSIAVLGILNMLEGAEGEMYRWKLAMRGVDIMLDDFGLTLTERKQLLATLRESFTTEFGGAKLLHKLLNDKYRKHQQEILSFMNIAADEANEITEVTDLYRQRSAVTAAAIAEIRQLTDEDSLQGGRYLSIIASHIHMFLNRIFVAKQRKHELVLYHFLEKYYLSQLAMVATAK